LAKLQNSNNKITEAIVKTNDFSVIQTEVTFTNFIVENNFTISVADNLIKLKHGTCSEKCPQIQNAQRGMAVEG
jgi:hypothetical protein